MGELLKQNEAGFRLGLLASFNGQGLLRLHTGYWCQCGSGTPRVFQTVGLQLTAVKYALRCTVLQLLSTSRLVLLSARVAAAGKCVVHVTVVLYSGWLQMSPDPGETTPEGPA